MERRTLIATVGIAVSVSGCLEWRHHGGIDTSIPAALEGLSFERLDQRDSAIDPSDEPVVRVDTDGQRVTIDGNVLVGSSECKQAKLDSVSVNDSAVRLEVTPGKSPQHHDYSLLGSSCTEGLGPDAYRIESPIPAGTDRIKVVETDFDGQSRVVSSELE